MRPPNPNPIQTPNLFKANRIQHVLILTSGAGSRCNDGSVDVLIRRVLDLKKNPILVLGPEGDEVLMSSKLAESCDLAFDPNFEGQIFSGIHAGLHAANGPAFIFPLVRMAQNAGFLNDDALWQQLESETLALASPQEVDVVAPVAKISIVRQDATLPANEQPYPQAISVSGARRLMNLPAQTNWGDTAEVRCRACGQPPNP